MASYIGNYEELLQSFQNEDYRFVSFDQIEKYGCIALRHDIDFDVHYAFQMAEIEHRNNIRSTFFFMMTSFAYNLHEKENQDLVHAIKSMGHTISLHFDPTVYNHVDNAFRRELRTFELLFDTKINIVSVHRPHPSFWEKDTTIEGVEHTYQRKYFKDIKYISDSQGIFRYGHPCQSEAFQLGETIHLLIHPIWWMGNGKDNLEVLDNFFENKSEEFKINIGKNCMPYQKFLERK